MILKANTTIELKCDWNGNFKLIDTDGIIWHYKREKWDECQKHMLDLIKPAKGDPK